MATIQSKLVTVGTLETLNKGRLHFSRNGLNEGLFDENSGQNVILGGLTRAGV